MMHLSKHNFIRLRKFQLIVVGILVLLFTIGGYTFWSNYSWSMLTSESTNWQKSINSDIKRIVDLPVASENQQRAVVDELAGIAKKITSDQYELCAINGIIQWQERLIGALKDARASCREKVAVAVEFQKKVNTVLDYAKNDQMMAKIIESSPHIMDLPDTVWEKQVIDWEVTIQATEAMTVTESFNPIRELAIARMKAVQTAWQEVVAAHQAKDKQRYVAAQNTLAGAIDGIDAISTTSQQTFSGLARELEDVSIKLVAN